MPVHPPELIRRVPKRAVAAGLLVIALAGALYAAGGAYQRRAETRLAEAELAHAAQAKQFAVQVADALAESRKILERYAEDAKVVDALSPAEPAPGPPGAPLRTATVPGARLLRLVPAGTVEPDTTSHPPLTYAAIDLFRKSAAQEAPVNAELHLGGTPDEHIALVRRVPPVGTPVGFLHLALAPARVREVVAGLEGGRLQVEVRQSVQGAPPVIIAKRGNGGDGRVDVAHAGVPGTTWHLVLRRREGARAGRTPDGVDRMALPAAALAIAGLGIVILRRRRRVTGSAVDTQPATDFQGAVRAIMAGDYPGLEGLLPGARVAAPKPRTQAPEFVATTEVPVTETTVVMQAPPTQPPARGGPIDPVIFRSYDIRGVVDSSLTNDAVVQIGLAIGSEAHALGQQTVVVARDGRLSSVSLQESLVQGLLASGRDVVDIGLTPTPVLYFATHYLDTRTGVMITGSHNPPEYNGLKIVMNGQALSGDAIQAIRRRIEQQDFTSGQGTLQHLEIVPDYIRRVSEEIPVSLGRELKVVVDCGNGVPGIVAPHILRAIGHDVIELYCEVDGEFPNHHPDPSEPANLEDLMLLVRHEDADLGLAFDGDGDRLGVVDRAGNIIWADRQLMLFARDVLSRNPGAKIVYDVKCSRHLADVIREAGGEPLMWKTGHSLIKSRMQETGALLGGEMSGHICFKDRWYGFDDALYAAARLLEILVNADVPPEQVFAGLPGGVATPELRIDMPESRHAGFMQQLKQAAAFPDATLTDIDGLRVDLADSWGLVRPSNTTPSIVLRFEGDDARALEAIQGRFRELLHAVDSSLTLPF
jgi:phosphomannomutase/phosphoglucomutase